MQSEEKHAVALARADERDVAAGGGADTRVRKEHARDSLRHPDDHEARPLSPGGVPEGAGDRAKGKERRWRRQIRAAGVVDDEREGFAREDRDLEGKRARLRIDGEHGDRGSEGAKGDRDRAGTGREQSPQEGLEEAGGSPRIELEGDAFELAAAMAELRNAAGHVEGETYPWQTYDELDHIEASQVGRA